MTALKGKRGKLQRMTADLIDGPLLPRKRGLTDPLQLRYAFTHGVDMPLHPLKVERMILPAVVWSSRVSQSGF